MCYRNFKIFNIEFFVRGVIIIPKAIGSSEEINFSNLNFSVEKQFKKSKKFFPACSRLLLLSTMPLVMLPVDDNLMNVTPLSIKCRVVNVLIDENAAIIHAIFFYAHFHTEVILVID